MSHTPGPWRWWGCRGTSTNRPDYAQIAAGRGEHVAKVDIIGTLQADLQLMVAAPALLAALQALLGSLEEHAFDHNDSIQARADAQAAIAFATKEIA